MRSPIISLIGGILILGCAHQKSIPFVTDGSETEEYPAIVALEFQSSTGEFLGICTGEFIAPRILLTAAHCFEDEAVPFLVIDQRKISAQRFLVHPQYVAFTETAVNHDLALIEFKDYQHSSFLPISKAKIKPGDEATLIGFGKSTFTTLPGHGIGTKRKGSLRIDKTEEAYFQAIKTAEKKDAAAAPGDSGGALLVADGIIGVTSLGAPEGEGRIVNQFVNLQSAASRAFLESAGWETEK